ncbi:hypothetical protein ENBRE01_2672 [Enteropsectra breve]|nr:hypothetical protein ENBRE01_2672 [Enteropsectra breve]
MSRAQSKKLNLYLAQCENARSFFGNTSIGYWTPELEMTVLSKTFKTKFLVIEDLIHIVMLGGKLLREMITTIGADTIFSDKKFKQALHNNFCEIAEDFKIVMDSHIDGH